MGLKDYLVFDGVPSTDFGVYVSGEGTFNAPEKMYESYEVSGRSGDIKLYTGRFKNISVSYKCVYYFHGRGRDFKRDIDGFRAFLLSKEGYCRLEDTHHKEEYRMALYKGGFDIDPSEHNVAAVFTLTFDCQPQRFLKTGEEPIEITDSYEFYTYINNPTRFPSSPLVAIYGDGTLQLNDYQITIQNVPYGSINVADFTRATMVNAIYCYFKDWLYQAGDIGHLNARWWVKFTLDEALPGTIEVETYSASRDCTNDVVIGSDDIITVGTFLQQKADSFVMGSTDSFTYESTILAKYVSNTTNKAKQETFTVSINIDIEETYVTLYDLSVSIGATYVKDTKQVDSVMVNSTASPLGNPMYVDMETGDAYKYQSGEKVYVNQSVWVGERLPVLSPGDNLIIQGENMSKVVITPRWWTI